ncbi:MAG: DNA-3-methyladenine glycosylase [Chloroflexota bacterium]|nr:MAG: DNA-3-methyladenine glycosylase [Chloroflexota bacterium]
MSNRLKESFFTRDTVQVARDLVGKRLVRLEGKQRISGIILETEAYRGEEDLACHCRAGRTPRTEIMYGPAGRAYIYLIYGMYWLLNFVTEVEESPGAVLIRAIAPEEGKSIIAQRRGNQPKKHWTDGPGKISIALGINGDLNGLNTCAPRSQIFIENGQDLNPGLISTGPRVGLESVPEPWRSIPWRFVVNYQHLFN